MPGLWQIFGEVSGWALGVPATLLALSKILGVLAYWRLEESRLSTVRFLLAHEENPSLRANLVKLLSPLQPPAAPTSAMPRLLTRQGKGSAE